MDELLRRCSLLEDVLYKVEAHAKNYKQRFEAAHKYIERDSERCVKEINEFRKMFDEIKNATNEDEFHSIADSIFAYYDEDDEDDENDIPEIRFLNIIRSFVPVDFDNRCS
jgi:uncharacterized protein (UPF0305 family)